MFHAAGLLGDGSVPPTRLARRLRPVLFAVLAVQCLLVVGRFFVLDLWGATLMFIVLVMGVFAVSSGESGAVDATCCLYYSLMCLVNGIFDVILCVERWVHVKYGFFERGAPVAFNVASALFLICPVVEMLAAALAAYIYADSLEAEARMLLLNPQYASVAAEISAMRGDLEAAAQGRQWRAQGGLGGPGFQPFRGQSHHL
mmetsp:Transcript_94752/g.203561  ORF Transcript_94752/g.203561 Transcript_94752/m.203561 type:complete len:201 (-) Transcript_94752:92-694(-)